MPIYEYECRGCGHQFELLILKGSPEPECPECKAKEPEQLISGFAVSSEGIRMANVQAARQKLAVSKDFKDRKIAEAEEIREHAPERDPAPRPKKAK